MPTPIDELLIELEARNETEDEFEQVKRNIDELDAAAERSTREAISRDRRLAANARAREQRYRRERAEIERTAAEIRNVGRADDNRTRRLTANAKVREQRARAERAEHEKTRAEVNRATAADNNRTKRFVASERTLQGQLRVTNSLINQQTTRIRAQASVIASVSRAQVAAERTKQTAIRQTTSTIQARNRLELEGLREVNREKARQFRRQERLDRQEFQRFYGSGGRGGGAGGSTGSIFAAGFGAGVGNRLQSIAGSIGAAAGGIYVLQSAFSSIIRDRARVQRLETGIRDLTDRFRQQAILPRLQEIALLPGLDYVTATGAFSRALSGGFTDEQSLRLINQIRNAVALSQGSIEDTNEVLRQFIQIQARGRFDQENLRPILERAPFIRRVIQEEFGTQIGGEIQQVIERRGQTTTEGILRIVERLAQGPVADPTTLQNALDNVGNELILLRNELGRSFEGPLRQLIDQFTALLRFLQTPGGQVISTAALVGLSTGAAGIAGRIIRGRRLGRTVTQRTGADRLAGLLGTSRFDIASGIARAGGVAGGLTDEISDLVFDFVNNETFRQERLLETQRRLGDANRSYRILSRGRPRRGFGQFIRDPFNVRRRRFDRNLADISAGITDEDRFLREALFLGPDGQPSLRRRLGASIFGRRGQRIPFSNIGARGGFGALLGTPTFLAAGAAVFGGARLGQNALDRRVRGEDNFLDRLIAGSIDIGPPIQRLQNLTRITFRTGEFFEALNEPLAQLKITVEELNRSVSNFSSELSTSATETVRVTQAFNEIFARSGRGEIDLSTTANRQQALSAFQGILNRISTAETSIRTRNTERENIRAQIRLEENRIRNLFELPDGTIRPFPRRQTSPGFQPTDEERELLDQYQAHTREIERLEGEYQKLRIAQNLQIQNVNMLRERYGDLNPSIALNLRTFRDVAGETEKAGRAYQNLEKVFPNESLKELNNLLQIQSVILGDLEEPQPVTYENLIENLQNLRRELFETSASYRQFHRDLTNREFITGLGPLEGPGGTLRPSIGRRIQGIIPRNRIGGTLRGGAPFPGGPIDLTDRTQIFGTVPSYAEARGLEQRAREGAFGAAEQFFDENPRIPRVDRIQRTREQLEELYNDWERIRDAFREANTQSRVDFITTGLIDPIVDNRSQIQESIRDLYDLEQSITNLIATAEGGEIFGTATPRLRTYLEEIREQIGLLNDQLDIMEEHFRDLQQTQFLQNIQDVELTDLEFAQRFPQLAGPAPTPEQIFNAPFFRNRRERLRERQQARAESFSGYFEGAADSLYTQFGAPSILDAIGIGSAQSAAQERALERLNEDVARQRQEIREDDTLNARQQADELLEINREYEREKRELERQYEEERSDAWKDWVRTQLTDFPRLIFQQLNLQLAARATNLIFRSLGIGGQVPITGPGIPGFGGGTFGGVPVSSFNQFGAAGAGRAAAAGGGAGGLATLGTVGAATGFALAGHNIITGAVPQFNPHGQSLFGDLGRDAVSPITTFFSNLIFENPLNDAIANAAGRARAQRTAANLGRRSARDIVRNYDEGFQEGQSSSRSYMISGDTTFNMPIVIGDREVRQISFTMDELASQGRL